MHFIIHNVKDKIWKVGAIKPKRNTEWDGKYETSVRKHIFFLHINSNYVPFYCSEPVHVTDDSLCHVLIFHIQIQHRYNGTNSNYQTSWNYIALNLLNLCNNLLRLSVHLNIYAIRYVLWYHILNFPPSFLSDIPGESQTILCKILKPELL